MTLTQKKAADASAASWNLEDILALYNQPFFDLVTQARQVHSQCWPANTLQVCVLCSVATGACSEDCSYCAQSVRHNAGLKKRQEMTLDEVVAAAKKAKAVGATRFCMGTAGRGPTAAQIEQVIPMIKAVKALGMETCVTLGLLTAEQTQQLRAAGLDYYNHNIDTAPSYYDQIIRTRTFADRLETIRHVRNAGIKVCCGGILGLGETRQHRGEMLTTLANLQPPPESVPINKLIPIRGTPLENQAPIDAWEIVRTIAVARIVMPHSYLKLAAGRNEMTEEQQAWCFFAGANSMFYGDKLLTTANAAPERDQQLFAKLDLKAEMITASPEHHG